MTTCDVTVRVCADDDSATYLFRCPLCRMTVVKEAESHIVELLAGSGVEVVVWVLPRELGERPAGGAPFDHDDLLDFHALLDDEAWFEQLVGSVDD